MRVNVLQDRSLVNKMLTEGRKFVLLKQLNLETVDSHLKFIFRLQLFVFKVLLLVNKILQRQESNIMVPCMMVLQGQHWQKGNNSP